MKTRLEQTQASSSRRVWAVKQKTQPAKPFFMFFFQFPVQKNRYMTHAFEKVSLNKPRRNQQ